MKPAIYKLVKLFILVAVLSSLESCKPKNFSTTKNSSGCGCSDLECWDNFTDKAVSRSLNCAKTSGLALVGVAGIKLIESLKGYYDLAAAAYDVELISFFQAAAGDQSLIAKWKTHPKFACVASAGGTIQKMLGLLNFAMSVNPNAGPEVAVGVLKASYDSLIGAFKFGEAASNCLASNGDKLDDSFGKVLGGLKKIAIGFAVFEVLKQCRFLFVDAAGGAENYQCLVQDWENLAAAEEKLAGMHETRVEGDPQNNSNPELCNDEALSCNTYAMGHWGSYLYNQGDGYFETRSYFCANNCGNNSDRGTNCNAVRNNVFRSFNQCAVAACETNQCENAMNLCISFCCKQDGSCVNAAQEKIGSYGYNKGAADAQPKYTVSFPGGAFSGGAVTGEGINCNRTTSFDCEAKFNAGSYLEFSIPTSITANGRTYNYSGSITCNGQSISKAADGNLVNFYIQSLNQDQSCSFNFE